MTNDEQRIRELIETWHRATAVDDVSTVLSLMAEDVVFLTSGQPPMRKNEFEKGLRELLKSHRITSTFEIKEIKIINGYAYCWNYLTGDRYAFGIRITETQGRQRPFDSSQRSWRCLGHVSRCEHARR